MIFKDYINKSSKYMYDESYVKENYTYADFKSDLKDMLSFGSYVVKFNAPKVTSANSLKHFLKQYNATIMIDPTGGGEAYLIFASPKSEPEAKKAADFINMRLKSMNPKAMVLPANKVAH